MLKWHDPPMLWLEVDISGQLPYLIYLTILEAAVGITVATAVADLRGKIPNIAIATTSGLGLLCAMSAMALRSLAGIPTATVADIPPWFFLALLSSYTFLVWIGQPGSRALMGLAAAFMGAFALLLGIPAVARGFESGAIYFLALFSSVALGSFLAAAVAVHWYMKAPDPQPVTVLPLIALGLAAALAQAIPLTYQLEPLRNDPSGWPLEIVALRAFSSVMLPLVLGTIALWMVARRNLPWAQGTLLAATLSTLIGSMAAPFAI